LLAQSAKALALNRWTPVSNLFAPRPLHSPFFSSVAHVWVPVSKNYWADCESLVFLKSNFYVSENFRIQCDPFSNKKDVSQRSSCRQWGLSEMAYLIFAYFSTKLGASVNGHEKIIT
jgi:hypothetical protein